MPKMRNWTGIENQIMKGYIIRAVKYFNVENPDKAIDNEILEELLQKLSWATDDMTAENAYDEYMKSEF